MRPAASASSRPQQSSSFFFHSHSLPHHHGHGYPIFQHLAFSSVAVRLQSTTRLTRSMDQKSAFHFPQPCFSPFHFQSFSAAATTTGTFNNNHYETLGLPNEPNVSAEQIKRAYFESAKKTHPDLHPGDLNAKAKFQEVSHAYQILSNPSSKAHYDQFGHDPGSNGAHAAGSSSTGGPYDSSSSNFDRDAKEAWQEVWVAYGFEHYVNEIKEEAYEAVMDIRERNDWLLAQEFASKHRLLLLGVMVPLALTLRYPPFILGGLRIAVNVVAAFYMYLPRHQKRNVLKKVWELITAAAAKRRHTQSKGASSSRNRRNSNQERRTSTDGSVSRKEQRRRDRFRARERRARRRRAREKDDF